MQDSSISTGRFTSPLPSPKPSIATREASPSSLPHSIGAPVSWSDSVQSKGISRCSLEYQVRSKTAHPIIANLRDNQVQTILLRCQVLQRTINIFAHRPWTANGHKMRFRYAERMQDLAHKARQLAAGLKDPGLQIRCEFWAGCASAAADDLSVAMYHFETVRGHDFGLLPQERRNFDLVLLAMERLRDAGNIDSISYHDFSEALDPVLSVRDVFTTSEKRYIKYGTKAVVDAPWSRLKATSTTDQNFDGPSGPPHQEDEALAPFSRCEEEEVNGDKEVAQYGSCQL
ncbi:hypothetical protein OPT61_g3884 [Boeremia exigua]|uniref:Uncharacterized protein n=1 Tax=Boeremia exigua TaxID=749465 RepID=A0ACC2IG77_9PLEO|nr:hypothetical protein OPT61_g3884 [Boeremia exigua]